MKLTKILSMLLVFVMVLCCLTACGGGGGEGDEDGGNAAADVKGAEQTWGNITLLVPEGMELKGGNILDENDPDVLNIHEKDNEFHYFMVTIYDEESCKNSISGTKDMNDEVKDVNLDVGGIKWTGVTYDVYGTPGLQVYAPINGKYALVSAYSYELDDDVTQAVLGSIKLS